MKKLLLTAFEPFGGDTVNSGERAVSALPDVIGEWETSKVVIPVVYGKAALDAAERAEKIGADAVLCIGQAGGRDAITPEMVAINLMHARIPDNDGNTPADEPIDKDGPAAYFSTLLARKMAEAAEKTGAAARVSYTAGTFVCNDIFYRLLRRFDGTGVKVGFVHVPLCREQGEPFIETEKTAAALAAMIEVM